MCKTLVSYRSIKFEKWTAGVKRDAFLAKSGEPCITVYFIYSYVKGTLDRLDHGLYAQAYQKSGSVFNVFADGDNNDALGFGVEENGKVISISFQVTNFYDPLRITFRHPGVKEEFAATIIISE